MVGVRGVETGMGEKKKVRTKKGTDDGKRSFRHSRLLVIRVCRLKGSRVAASLLPTEMMHSLQVMISASAKTGGST